MQKRVLVVDDDEAVRTIVSQVLGHAGFDVSTASDGARALKQVNRSPRPDVILLDLMMPGIDGWEALAALRAQGFDIPVIVVTGFDSGEGLPAGVPVLHKPIDASVLIEMVCHCLGQPTIFGRVSPEFYDRALEAMTTRRRDVRPTR